MHLQPRLPGDSVAGPVALDLRTYGRGSASEGTVKLLDGSISDVIVHLRSVNLRYEWDDKYQCFTFPLVDMPKLLRLGDRVRLMPTETARLLWDMLRCTGTSPAVITVKSGVGLWVRHEPTGLDQQCDRDLASGIVQLRLPVVSDQKAGFIIREFDPVGTRYGTMWFGHSGFVEVATSQPQQVEAMSIPGLFKIRAGRYGAPLAATSALEEAGGIVWTNPPPEPPLTADRALSVVGPIVLKTERTNQHAARSAALDLLRSLDSDPVVLCPDHSVVCWEEAGARVTVNNPHELNHRFESLVVDGGRPLSLDCVEALRPRFLGTDRPAVAVAWDEGSVGSLLAALRPEEFDFQELTAGKYPQSGPIGLPAHKWAYQYPVEEGIDPYEVLVAADETQAAALASELIATGQATHVTTNNGSVLSILNTLGVRTGGDAPTAVYIGPAVPNSCRYVIRQSTPSLYWG